MLCLVPSIEAVTVQMERRHERHKSSEKQTGSVRQKDLEDWYGKEKAKELMTRLESEGSPLS